MGHIRMESTLTVEEMTCERGGWGGGGGGGGVVMGAWGDPPPPPPPPCRAAAASQQRGAFPRPDSAGLIPRRPHPFTTTPAAPSSAPAPGPGPADEVQGIKDYFLNTCQVPEDKFTGFRCEWAGRGGLGSGFGW